MVFESQGNSSDDKQAFNDILGKFSYFIMKMHVVCTHLE